MFSQVISGFDIVRFGPSTLCEMLFAPNLHYLFKILPDVEKVVRPCLPAGLNCVFKILLTNS